MTQQLPDSEFRFADGNRSFDAHYAEVAVSIPPSHEPGQIEWPTNRPDPLDDFAVVKFDPSDSAAQFYQAIAEAPGDTVYLFIHGYNNTTSEALYRYAQIATDFDLPQARAMFSWPSAGTGGAYIYDRDSVLFARDGLAAMLTQIARRTGKDINLLAHSMGAMLSMEAMRQLAIAGDQDVLQRIDVVTFLSPDIDPDVFRMQANAIGTLPQPFVILTSRSDKALRISSLLAGGRAKVGSIESAEDVADLGVTFIDFTNVSDGQHMDHMVALTSPEAIRILRGMVAVGLTTSLGDS
ncbi:alpha/beta hydrolase [Yoonia sp. BS5-3]|uniref:Alpha/beta hydrolase n=1 Tax=Yoonia phaeophyticola TaxID=3137369 RepID=A0ABZ2V769_9RHOB